MDSSIPTRIDTPLLIPGRGSPLKNTTIIVSSKKISHVGPTAELPQKYQNLSTTTVPVLMPGLWDAHVHYFGARKISIDEIYRTPPAAAGARIAADLKATIFGSGEGGTVGELLAGVGRKLGYGGQADGFLLQLDAGFTSVRELGGWGYQIKDTVNEGTIPGPSIYSSVSPISMTAGHGDAHATPLPVIKDAIESYGLPLSIADGSDGCLKAVRSNLRRGASLIKVIASGGCTSSLDDPEHRQFSDEELKVMVDEAKRSDRLVSAHCHGKAGIMAALKAGVGTIEHGTYLDEECLDLMKEKNAILIATRNFFEGGLQVPELWNPESYAKLEYAAGTHKAAYKLAVKSGVRIALGTDLGVSGSVMEGPRGRVFSHGSNARELQYAVDAGMTPLQVIEAATATAAETLGAMAPKSGRVETGWDADLLGVEGDVLSDIGILVKGGAVQWIWKGGTLVKSPGKGL